MTVDPLCTTRALKLCLIVGSTGCDHVTILTMDTYKRQMCSSLLYGLWSIVWSTNHPMFISTRLTSHQVPHRIQDNSTCVQSNSSWTRPQVHMKPKSEYSIGLNNGYYCNLRISRLWLLGLVTELSLLQRPSCETHYPANRGK